MGPPRADPHSPLGAGWRSSHVGPDRADGARHTATPAAWHSTYGNLATLHYAHALVSQQRSIEAGRARGLLKAARGGIRVGLELRRSARVVSELYIVEAYGPYRGC
jgi:hypothetical protein